MAKISDDLWIARLRMEVNRHSRDPSTVFIGELANVLAEYSVTTVAELRIRLDMVAPDKEECEDCLEREDAKIRWRGEPDNI